MGIVCSVHGLSCNVCRVCCYGVADFLISKIVRFFGVASTRAERSRTFLGMVDG